jgi:hypothetical protein
VIDVSVLTVLSLVIWVALLSRAVWLVVHPPHQHTRRAHRVLAG